ncbi:hypothetical protein PU560_04795 [Georgenia sp. 10Sc9-8]|uniref:Uncharacterized protein n=1 Tax=Georgenia halotolerans TaxID=3028317 RepID=A0ABT5TUX9_9MICO|nr:hypothetical protein [Georgenia halotolerans]
MHPGVAAATAVEIARRARDAGATAFALQQAREIGTRDGLTARAAGWDAECAALAARVEALGFDRFTFRPA